jgi:hypothetical protein
MKTTIDYDAGYATIRAIRCKAFGGIVRTHSVRVDDEGEVTVYNPFVGYYTSCHGLSARTVERIRKLVS